MKLNQARFSIRCASMVFGATVTLGGTSVSAQERRLQDIDCRATQDAMRKAVLGQGLALPTDISKADLDYCMGMPFKDPSVVTRLSVRPHEMATGTRTDRAGEHTLDSLENYLVYVPQQCVGTRRCPLVVFLHGAASHAGNVMKIQRPVADKYGMIVFAPSSPSMAWTAAEELTNRKNVDAGLKQILQKFAIDPNKIALIGRCNGGPSSSIWGGDNLDIFSRILPISAGYPPTAGVDAPNTTAEFFLDAGYLESEGNFQAARELRQAGHRVKHVVGFRGHMDQAEDYDFVGRWLQESWATPNPAARTAPSVVANPLPLLTTDVVTQMTTFWNSFQQEPDSIRTTARWAHLREVIVPIGEERPSTVMVDMPALAAKYPTVAAALKAAGLTAQQHEAYRVALLSASIAKNVRGKAGTVEANSVLAKNIEFMDAHADELKMLETTRMWDTP